MKAVAPLARLVSDSVTRDCVFMILSSNLKKSGLFSSVNSSLFNVHTLMKPSPVHIKKIIRFSRLAQNALVPSRDFRVRDREEE